MIKSGVFACHSGRDDVLDDDDDVVDVDVDDDIV